MLNFIGIGAVIVTMMTAYNPIAGQTDSEPFIASRNKPVESCTVALSRGNDLGVKLDDRLCIALPELKECNYEVKAWDRLNIRKKETQLDVFMWSLKDARAFGVKRAIPAYVVKDGFQCKDLPMWYIGYKAHKMFNSVRCSKHKC